MKKSLLLSIFLFFVAIAELFSIELDFNGYVYVLPTYQKLPKSAKLFNISEDNDSYFMDLNRFRLRPTLHLSEDTRITMHYELDFSVSNAIIPYQTNYGKTNRQVLNLHNKFIDNKIDNNWNLIAEHFIDLLYFKHSFDFGEITAGRQVISWGVGRVWQPTDLFNPLNPANFSKFEKDGVDAVSFKYFAGNFTDIEFVYNFRETIKQSNVGARFRTNFNEYDVSLMTGYFDEKYAVGADFTGNFFGAGLRGEAIYKFHKDKDSSFFKCIAGLDYQFTSDIYGLIEYQFNGEGTANKDKYINYFERLAKGEIQNLGKNYLTSNFTYLIHPLVNSGLMVLTNLDDMSGYVGLNASWSALDELNLKLGTMFFWGEEKTEYSYYSTAVYLIGEFFF